MAKATTAVKARHSFRIEGAVEVDDDGRPTRWNEISNAIITTHPTLRQAALAATNEILRLTRGKTEREKLFRKEMIEV